MKDQNTIYQSDDGTATVFFKFVASTAGDLLTGTLQAAKAAQNEDESLAITWIELGTATIAQVKAWIDEYNPGQAKANTWIADEDTTAWANGTVSDDRAAFLESRKAAAAKGATAGFQKI